MWTKETLRAVVQTKKFAVILSTVVSTATGFAAGYVIAKKRLDNYYVALAEREIHEAKLYYRRQNKLDEYSDPTVLAEKYDDVPEMSKEDAELMDELKAALNEAQYSADDILEPSPQEKVEVKESLTKNIFDVGDEGDFVLDDELDKKAKGLPYILEEGEYYENESEYSQTSLTYYEGDNVLADQQDRAINDVRKVIGEGNLRFGYGTNDPNLVFIRNDKLNAEYEIARSNGKYAEEVLGFMEHSEKSPLRKFRAFD